MNKRIFGILSLFLLMGCSRQIDAELIGDKEVILKVGELYIEEGLSIDEEDYEISGTVDVDIPGEYTIEYLYGKEQVLERIVNVLEVELSLIGDEEMFVPLGEEFEDLGYTANFDGVRASINVNTTELGTYDVTYQLDEKTVTRVVHVVDLEAPTLELIGEIEQFSIDLFYEEEGYSASDNSFEKVNILVTEIVNEEKNVKKITYTATDSSGNSTEKTRIIRDVLVNLIEKFDRDELLGIGNEYQVYTYSSEKIFNSDTFEIMDAGKQDRVNYGYKRFDMVSSLPSGVVYSGVAYSSTNNRCATYVGKDSFTVCFDKEFVKDAVEVEDGVVFLINEFGYPPTYFKMIKYSFDGIVQWWFENDDYSLMYPKSLVVFNDKLIVSAESNFKDDWSKTRLFEYSLEGDLTKIVEIDGHFDKLFIKDNKLFAAGVTSTDTGIFELDAKLNVVDVVYNNEESFRARYFINYGGYKLLFGQEDKYNAGIWQSCPVIIVADENDDELFRRELDLDAYFGDIVEKENIVLFSTQSEEVDTIYQINLNEEN